ncbi:MAG: DNA polymerase IV [Olsenella sp.]|nr:DNA polymerase IV [Olsenella sp.]
MESSSAPEANVDIPWEGPAIGLLDLDAFFASVEQLDHPAWRGRPVIVGGSAERRGVVSTASYEARAYGVHSAMPSAQARKLCPDAIWVQGDHARYREMSDRVMAVILDETPLVEQVSIDEAFFDVSPGHWSRESPISICRRIQSRVADLGVTCSIGLSTSKTISKIASDMDKPNGLTVIMPGGEQDFLSPLPVRSMSGIGPALQARLAERGVHTLGQLARQDPARMEREFGIAGPSLVRRAAGLEHAPVRSAYAPEEVKSVSNERTFAEDLTDRDEVEQAIRHISDLVARRLRRKALKGCVVHLKLKYDYRSGHTAQGQLPEPSDDPRQISRLALGLLDGVWHEGQPVRLLGVGVSGFSDHGPSQLGLFDEPTGQDEALRRLDETTDALRERFGSQAISYGRDLRFRERTSDTQPMSHGTE